MKNTEVLRAADRVLAFAKAQGFSASALEFVDENYDVYESLDDLAEAFGQSEILEIDIRLILDKVTVDIVEDEDTQELEVRVSGEE